MQKMDENTARYGIAVKPLKLRHTSNSKMNINEWKNVHISIAYRADFSSRLKQRKQKEIS